MPLTLQQRLISIHTPAKGVTGYSSLRAGITNISIHTPAKGVTPPPSPMEQMRAISIHTPAKGVTQS